ncbi:hypothetical protein [Sinomonas gamaensis]|uniref:hypothetical protein n=1 Tax=Sinomonas gamaensis TaxID=2565624 RepID=UPI001107DAC5|nr:hypothetical protein [Sinomonas gamaensis]
MSRSRTFLHPRGARIEPFFAEGRKLRLNSSLLGRRSGLQALESSDAIDELRTSELLQPARKPEPGDERRDLVI